MLCYHSVDPRWDSALAVTPETFERHCEWLARRRTIVDVTRAADTIVATGRLPRGLACLSFDDGFASLYEHAWPVLAKRGLPAVVFLVARSLGSGNGDVDWVDDPPPFSLRALALEQVLEMQERGVTFGSHSLAHRDLTSLGEDECERDLRDSRDLLEDALGRPVTLLAYPRGRHSATVRSAAGKAGFTHAFAMSKPGQPITPLSIPRVGIYSTDAALTLNGKTSWSYVRLRRSSAFPALRSIASSVRRRSS